ncbi:MAG: hypothetical protein AAFQ22_04120 [Pseudomonadota bacterium]
MTIRKTLTTAIAAAIAAASLATANAQGFGQPQQGAAGFHGASKASPAVAARFNNSSYRIIQGNIMMVVSYSLNGECGATMGGRTGGRSISTQACAYSVQEIAPGRVQMRSSVTVNGQTSQDTTTLQLRPDGSMVDEKYRAHMVRIQ